MGFRIEGGAALTRRLESPPVDLPSCRAKWSNHRPVEGAQTARTLAMEGHHGSRRVAAAIRRPVAQSRYPPTVSRHQRALPANAKGMAVFMRFVILPRKVFAIPESG